MNSNKIISILGCGWLGFELAKSLIRKGHTVKGSTTRPHKIPVLKSVSIDPFLVDLNLDEYEFNDPFYKSDILIIAIPPGRRDPESISNHSKRIKRILLSCQKWPSQNILLISSTGVFASKTVSAPGWRFPEYIGQEPNDIGTSKSAEALITAEEIISSSHKERSTIVRFGGLVGGDRIAGRFLAGKKDIVNGMAPVNMIHRDDCIGIIQSIIEHHHWGEIFNATADEHPSRKTFYTAQAHKYGLETPTFKSSTIASGKIVSNSKLVSETGYQFIHPDPMLF